MELSILEIKKKLSKYKKVPAQKYPVLLGVFVYGFFEF
jgi:hypothetical protein